MLFLVSLNLQELNYYNHYFFLPCLLTLTDTLKHLNVVIQVLSEALYSFF